MPTAKCTLLAGCGLLLAACDGAPASRPAGPASRFQHLAGSFYRSRAGRLFEKRESVAGAEAEPESWYDSTVVLRKAGGTAEALLSDVIDLASYQDLNGSSFSKDKNHVYYSYANSGGGFRTVVGGADPATFRPSPDYQYGFDARHGYYCDRPLRGLRLGQCQLLLQYEVGASKVFEQVKLSDLKQYRLLYPADTVPHSIQYVKDDQHVFCEATPIAGADARTFHLVRGPAGEAADKNHRYQYGGQRLK